MSGRPFHGGHARFRAGVRRFVERELAPRVERWERDGRFPRRALAECGRRGYLALDPERNGVLAEELPRCESLGVALTIFVQAGLVGPTLERLATPAQKRDFLAPLTAGRLSGALAVSEPAAGSDLAALACRATPDARGLVVDGEKTYITNAAAADFFVVAVRHEGTPEPNLSLLLVPAGATGVRVTPLASLGLATTAMGRIMFRRCRVPAANVLGDPGRGYGYVQEALDRERLYEKFEVSKYGFVASAEFCLINRNNSLFLTDKINNSSHNLQRKIDAFNLITGRIFLIIENE